MVAAQLLAKARTAQKSKVLGMLAVSKESAGVCCHCFYQISSVTKIWMPVYSCDGGYQLAEDGKTCTAL